MSNDELTRDDLEPGTEIVYQTPNYSIMDDADFYPPVRGTVTDVRSESLPSGLDEASESEMVVLDTEDEEEKQVALQNLIGETDFRVNIDTEEA